MVSATSPAARWRIAGAMFIAQSLFSAAVIAAFTVTPIIAAELSGRDSAAGWPSTVNLLGRAAAAYPLGWLLDRAGRRLGLSLGYAVGVLAAAFSAYAVIIGSLSGFLIGAGLLGGSRAASEQGRYVAAEVFPSSWRAKIIGLIVSAGTIGAIGGPLLVVPSEGIGERFGVSGLAGPFILTGVFLLIAALIIFIMVRPDPLEIGRDIMDRERTARPGEEDSPGRPLREIFRSRLAVLAVASMMVGQIVMTLLMVITPLHMSHHEHDTKAISWVIMAHTLGMFGLSWFTGWLIDHLGRVPMIVVGTLILVAACGLAPISTEVPLLALALFLLGLGWNFCFVAGSSLLSDQLKTSERGRGQGASDVAVALGAGAGSLGTGAIFSRGDMIAVSLAGLAVTLALFAAAIWVMVPRQPAQAFAPSQD